MAGNIIHIESATQGVVDKVKQTLAFRTGKFVWRVKFNIPLNPSTINNKNLYVTTLNLVPLKTYIRYDTVNKYIEIEPLEPYAENESYILNITKNVKSQGGQNLKSPIQVQFKI